MSIPCSLSHLEESTKYPCNLAFHRRELEAVEESYMYFRGRLTSTLSIYGTLAVLDFFFNLVIAFQVVNSDLLHVSPPSITPPDFV